MLGGIVCAIIPRIIYKLRENDPTPVVNTLLIMSDPLPRVRSRQYAAGLFKYICNMLIMRTVSNYLDPLSQVCPARLSKLM